MQCFDIKSDDNIELLAQLIAAESAGCTEVEVDKDDIEMAVVTAGFIKQLVNGTHSGCIVREVHNCD